MYLLEASIDPAQEAQAAGRIHRLGQTKEVLVKRFYFRASIDEAIAALHGQIASGGLKLGSGGTFPAEALALFQRHGVAQPHTRDESAPHVETRRRYTSADKANVDRHGGRGGFDYGKKVMTQVCRCCDQPVEVPGTSVWWGKGKWAPLLNGCTDDNPACLGHASADSYYLACFSAFFKSAKESLGEQSSGYDTLKKELRELMVMIKQRENFWSVWDIAVWIRNPVERLLRRVLTVLIGTPSIDHLHDALTRLRHASDPSITTNGVAEMWARLLAESRAGGAAEGAVEGAGRGGARDNEATGTAEDAN